MPEVPGDERRGHSDAPGRCAPSASTGNMVVFAYVLPEKGLAYDRVPPVAPEGGSLPGMRIAGIPRTAVTDMAAGFRHWPAVTGPEQSPGR